MAHTDPGQPGQGQSLPVLEQSVELAKLAEKASVVRAPCDGTILEVYCAAG